MVFLGVLSTFNGVLVLLPAQGAEQPILGVVKSEENAGQWSEITSRLQATGVAYCVIDLPTVRSVSDLGDHPVLFLPNVERIAPTQAIASGRMDEPGWTDRCQWSGGH